MRVIFAENFVRCPLKHYLSIEPLKKIGTAFRNSYELWREEKFSGFSPAPAAEGGARRRLVLLGGGVGRTPRRLAPGILQLEQ